MKKFYAIVAAGLTVLATFTVIPASYFFYLHQPKTPKCLLK